MPATLWDVKLRPDLESQLARLAPDQLAAATAPPGPVLCVAPAGSGKTTTLVARIAWLVATGTPPERIAAITFNRRAAEELVERLSTALGPLGVPQGAVRVRTFHALGREILRSAGDSVEPLADRATLLRRLWPDAGSADLRRLDDAFSRLKLDAGVTAADVAGDPDPGPIGEAFARYEATVAETGGLDFDDLVARALARLEADPILLGHWRDACGDLLVDEVQDVDRSQLRLALLLAAPAHRIFLVGDDDQSIYGWRLADVRRVLGLAAALPGLTRVDLETNYRCPTPVVERAVRLVARNRERFVKAVRPRPGATGRLVLAADAADDAIRISRVFASWPDDGSTRAVLARTNRELLPAAVVALELGIPFRAARLRLLVEDGRVDGLLERLAAMDGARPLPVRAEALRRSVAAEAEDAVDEPLDGDACPDAAPGPSPSLLELGTALVAWSLRYPDVDTLATTIAAARARLAALRRDDAQLTLATVHATKGLEWDHVAVIGMEAARFPSARALMDAQDPGRALEEERRLAYVAWTRARRSLTLLYDPTTPSPFLREAFDEDELGLDRTASSPSGTIEP